MSTIPEMKAKLLSPGTPFAFVQGATALSQVKDRPDAVLPGAYVLSAREVSADNDRATGPVLQRQERDIMVVIVAEDLGDAKGDAVQDELEELKAWCRRQLIGFRPSDMVDRITHVGGEIVQASHGCVWFEDTYSAPTFIKEQR